MGLSQRVVHLPRCRLPPSCVVWAHSELSVEVLGGWMEEAGGGGMMAVPQGVGREGGMAVCQ